MIAAPNPVASNPVRRLPGMRDIADADYRHRWAVEARLTAAIGLYGYQSLDVPILESTELFLRKSGGDLASQMYSFTDPGSNAVSLRPEFTSAIMRHYLEMAPNHQQRNAVVRWQYAGPVFRYDLGNPPSAENGGQFTQVGAELIGSDSILADAELLSLAAEIPAELGIADYRLRVADLDVLDSVLDTVGLSDRARAFIVANMNRIGDDAASLAETLQRADELHIVSGRGLPTEEIDLADAVAGLPDGLARSVLAGFMRWNNSPETPLGRRTPDEIVDRLLRKLRGGDAPDAIERGLALAGQLARVHGSPGETLAQVNAVVSESGASTLAYQRLVELIELVADAPSVAGRLEIDFSLARGIAYYNGIIFDVVRGQERSPLGGGGRYDALALALGGQDPVPALGFAYSLESLLSAASGQSAADPWPDATLVSPETQSSNAAALRAAADIRRQGGVALVDVGHNPPSSRYSQTVVV